MPNLNSDEFRWDLNDAGPQHAEPEPDAPRAKRGRYVKWQEIKRAVRGREADALRNAGIAHRGDLHINCPYSAHPDRNPSWRLMDTGKVVCTCRGVHSVFDSLMALEGIDVDAAKIRVAELIGREDLIVDPDAPKDEGVTVEWLAEAKQLPLEFFVSLGWFNLKSRGKHHDKPPAVGHMFRDGKGGEWLHIRVAKTGKKKFVWKKGDKGAPLYGAQYASALPGAGYVILCEGETDYATLYYNRKPVLALPGADNWSEDRHAPLFENVPVIFVVIERDAGGAAVLKWLARSRIRDRVRLLYMPKGIKDPSALWCNNPDPESFNATLLACLEAAQPFSARSADAAEAGAKAPGPRPGARDLDIGSDIEIAHAVAADLRDAHGDVLFDDGDCYYFNKTDWHAIDYVDLRLSVHAYDGSYYKTANEGDGRVSLSKSRVDSTLHEMRAILIRRHTFDDAPPGINCASGFIMFDKDGTPKLLPHDPAHKQRHTLPGRWHEGDPAPTPSGSLLHTLLYGIFKDDPDERDKLRLISQIAGCAALGYATNLGRPKALIFDGVRAENGKSQVVDMLRGLLPASAIASVPITKLGDPTYLVRLAGKMLNATDEVKGGGAIAGEIFKACVTGEVVTARDLYRSAIEFRPRALQVHAANSLPSFEGGFDRGVLRRLLVVVFNRVIPASERVRFLGKRIAAEEPDALLAFAVRGASDLIKAGDFSIPPSSEQALTKWAGTADPVIAWVALFVEPGELPMPATRVEGLKSGYVHKMFREWALAAGYRADSIPAVNGFVQRLLAAVPGAGTRHTVTGNVLVGMKLRPNSNQYDSEMDAEDL